MLIDPLEIRRHYSVTVSQSYPGFYEVQGDNDPNTIAITVSMADQTFTLDGTTYSDVQYIFVQGFEGNDVITVRSVDGPGTIGASISGDDGDDTLAMNFDGGIWAGSGNDTMVLTDSYRGQAYGDGGNDRIFISGACVDAEIVGDSGNDYIDCSGSQSGVVVYGGSGNDTIVGSAFDDQLYGDEGTDSIVGGAGDDAIFIGGGRGDYVDGGKGHDILYCGSGNQTDATLVSIEEIYS